jgi:hypothetical protein
MKLCFRGQRDEWGGMGMGKGKGRASETDDLGRIRVMGIFRERMEALKVRLRYSPHMGGCVSLPVWFAR